MTTLPNKDYHFGSYAQQRENPNKIFIYSTNLQEDGRFCPDWSPKPWAVVGKHINTSTFHTHAEAIAYADTEAQ